MPRHVKQAENPVPEKRIFPPPEIEPEEVAVVVRSSRDIIETDEMPMDSGWHYLALHLLPGIINWNFRARQDFYVGGDMFIYYKNAAGTRIRFLGPDFLYVKGVPRQPLRRYWMVWKENGVFPNVAIELLSPRTRKTDLGIKKDRYERELRIPEYFVYDPEQRLS